MPHSPRRKPGAVRDNHGGGRHERPPRVGGGAPPLLQPDALGVAWQGRV